jgi:hypothetical protein|tara:strand:+ start:293 stop:2209 length:1917 start_codon:yes stop_codon:yes gene_type:complete
MALKELFKRGISSLLKRKKTDPVSGESQKLITYTPEAKKQTAKQLAKQDAQRPVKVDRKITDDLLMGESQQPAFGSATYDWVMKKGPGKYNADEWINHLTSTRTVNYKIFGKPTKRIERGPKRFTYDKGSRFAGKEATINKEELFDTNLATFDELGNITGGLLGAAKRFGLKLSAQDIGNMIKMNPVNRLKPVEFGGVFSTPKTDKILQGVASQIDDLSKTKPMFMPFKEIKTDIGGLSRAVKNGDQNSIKNNYDSIIKTINNVKSDGGLNQNQLVQLNGIRGSVDELVRISKGGGNVRPVKYQNETSYTFPGGQNYRETVFVLDEPIVGNKEAMRNMGHYEGLKNNLFHVRYDTRMTPNGKKALVIHEIQSDANQSIAKQLSAKEAFKGEKRINPFQRDIELNLLVNSRTKLLKDMDDAIAKNQFNKSRTISDDLKSINSQIKNTFTKAQDDLYGTGGKLDYYPLLDADAYGDYALKFLMNKAAKENIDYVAVMPFNKLHFRQGYKAGNERFYGYSSGKGIDKKGQAVMPQLMKKTARFQDSKAGPIKLSLSDPKLPYKEVKRDTFKYPEGKNLKNINSSYHETASNAPMKGYKLIQENDPRLYFDAFAIEVKPGMAYTQKLYKSKGGLVVDIFKTL